MSSTERYIQTIERDNACDSLLTLQLSLMSADSTFQSEMFCEGGSVIVNGEEYQESGIFYQDLDSQSGCDSVLVLSITEENIDSTLESASFCEGASIIIGGEEYTEAGMYSQSFTNQAGCDSILFLTLSTLSLDSTILETSICPGESVLISGIEYTETGIYEQAYTNQAGCDSTVIILIGNESGCVDCELTEDGNFKTDIDLYKIGNGKLRLQVNKLQSLDINESEIVPYLRLFIQEEAYKNTNGMLHALHNKATLNGALLVKHIQIRELDKVSENKLTELTNTIKDLKAGNSVSFWISI